MELTQYIFLGSLAALTLLAVLFRFEDKQEQRVVLGGVRGALDGGIVVIGNMYSRFIGHIGQGTVRQTSHFLLHRALKALLATVERIEDKLRQMQVKNREVAHADRVKYIDQRMSEVSDHAASIKMSPEEKRKERLKMLK